MYTRQTKLLSLLELWFIQPSDLNDFNAAAIDVDHTPSALASMATHQQLKHMILPLHTNKTGNVIVNGYQAIDLSDHHLGMKTTEQSAHNSQERGPSPLSRHCYLMPTIYNAYAILDPLSISCLPKHVQPKQIAHHAHWDHQICLRQRRYSPSLMTRGWKSGLAVSSDSSLAMLDCGSTSSLSPDQMPLRRVDTRLNQVGSKLDQSKIKSCVSDGLESSSSEYA